jgi:RimJ/RimL family protein N-acetyltransferase
MTALITERLRLERWVPAHGGMLARLAAMPEVMRHIGAGTTWTAAEAHEHSARALVHWREHGFGWRAAVERTTARPVGLIALNFAGPEVPELADDEYEIGWWIEPELWGRGYATEGGRAIRDEAFALGASSVVARIYAGNAASVAVAATLGLRPEREATNRHGLPVRILRARNGGEPRGG